MTPNDAQASLDDIHRLQGETLDEYVRHSFSRRYVRVSALAMFIVFASLDLRSPWNTAAYVLALGLFVGVGIVQWRRAPVRRRQGGKELAFLLGVSGGLVVVVSVFSLITGVMNHMFGLPAPHAVAGVVVALLFIVIIELTRPVYRAIVRR